MMSEVIQKGKAAKTSSYLLTGVTTEEKNKALRFIAEQIVADQDRILEENKKDIAKGKEQGLTDAVLDRIMLNETRIQDMAQAIHLLVDLQDRSEEHTSELQSRGHLVCRLLLEKKNTKRRRHET